MSSGPASPGLSAACACRRGPARSSCTRPRARRRPLPLLSRSDARPRHRQRQPSAAVRQPRGARLSRPHRSRASLHGPPSPRLRLRRPRERRALAAAIPTTGRVPWWLLDPEAARSRHDAWRIFRAARRVRDAGDRDGRRRDVLLRAALRTAVAAGAARGVEYRPAGRLRGARGGDAARDPRRGRKACRPLIARGRAFARASSIRRSPFSRRAARRCASATACEAIPFDGGRAVALDFDRRTTLRRDDAVVLAVPPWVARDLLPDLDAPDEFRAIVNAHFRVGRRAGQPRSSAWSTA